METKGKNFIEQIIDRDLEEGRAEEDMTRFPPAPNGYLHIGHAKSILLNYGLAQEYHGKFNLRFDDTNPTKEKSEFVESIKNDVKWLGADYEDRLFFASDYFDEMYEAAVKLIRKGKAFVCDLTAEQIREYRGTLTEAGKDSPYRNRSVEENLELFENMKNGMEKALAQIENERRLALQKAKENGIKVGEMTLEINKKYDQKILEEKRKWAFDMMKTYEDLEARIQQINRATFETEVTTATQKVQAVSTTMNKALSKTGVPTPPSLFP